MCSDIPVGFGYTCCVWHFSFWYPEILRLFRCMAPLVARLSSYSSYSSSKQQTILSCDLGPYWERTTLVTLVSGCLLIFRTKSSEVCCFLLQGLDLQACLEKGASSANVLGHLLGRWGLSDLLNIFGKILIEHFSCSVVDFDLSCGFDFNSGTWASSCRCLPSWLGDLHTLLRAGFPVCIFCPDYASTRNKSCIPVLSKSSKFFTAQTLCRWVIFKHCNDTTGTLSWLWFCGCRGATTGTTFCSG